MVTYLGNNISIYSSNIESLGMKHQQKKDREEVFEEIRTKNVDTYCFALLVTKFNKADHEYEFEVSYLRQNLPDTNRPAFDP